MDFHLAMPSETDRMTLLELFEPFTCPIRLLCKRKSAGDGSSSVIRRRIPSGKSNGDSMVDVCLNFTAIMAVDHNLHYNQLFTSTHTANVPMDIDSRLEHWVYLVYRIRFSLGAADPFYQLELRHHSTYYLLAYREPASLESQCLVDISIALSC